MQGAGQTLFFDADDTLWQNNVYFERAISAFISCLDPRHHSGAEIRDHLNAVERHTIAQHGYGLGSFKRSLIRCFEDLTGGPVSQEKHRSIVSFVDSIADQQMELLPGVPETLQELASRHTLLLVTKGDTFEQTEKLVRSGLADRFSAIEVLAEKTPSAYCDLLARHGCEPARTWMIGNSPRSDINPALKAGINTVFIPHDFTWVLEHESVDAPPPGLNLIELSSFSLLLEHF